MNPKIIKTCLEKVYNSKITHDTETGYHEFFTQSDLISKKYIIIDELYLNYMYAYKLFYAPK